jgi:hypothetical protein
VELCGNSNKTRSGASDLVLESRFVGDEVPAVEDTWLGRLWRWVSGAGLQLGLRGRSICGGGVQGGWMSLRPQTGERGLKGSTNQLAVLGCSKPGVSTVSDLLQLDGTYVRTELRVGGEWTNQCRYSKSEHFAKPAAHCRSITAGALSSSLVRADLACSGATYLAPRVLVCVLCLQLCLSSGRSVSALARSLPCLRVRVGPLWWGVPWVPVAPLAGCCPTHWV